MLSGECDGAAVLMADCQSQRAADLRDRFGLAAKLGRAVDRLAVDVGDEVAFVEPRRLARGELLKLADTDPFGNRVAAANARVVHPQAVNRLGPVAGEARLRLSFRQHRL